MNAQDLREEGAFTHVLRGLHTIPAVLAGTSREWTAVVRIALAVVLGMAAVAACSDERPPGETGPNAVSVHPVGILDPESPDFHGRELERRNWSFALCATCHGEDFTGGAAKTSCLGCHAEGPTACTTCHGAAGPTTNAHVVHRDAGKLTCGDCHLVPASWDADGHLLRDGVVDPPPAEVVFGARAGLTLDPADRGGAPTFSDGRCSNVYCHGDALHAAGGLATRPRWDDPATPGACDRCHGAPPPTHAQDRCESCHPTTAPHVDGIVQIGRGAGCSGCHGDETSAAPPGDLSGNTLTTLVTVGAHRAHVEAPSGLRGPIPCAACHRVPSRIGDPGHIDSAPPAEVNANLAWDRDSATCAAAACHGGAHPVWTTSVGAPCGSCHGLPPRSGIHNPSMPLTSCATCHPQTVDATGAIVLTPGPDGPTSAHMNGTVDVL